MTRAMIENEVLTINKIFQQKRVMAKIIKAENVLDSFVRYQLRLHNTESFSSVEKMLRELTVAVNRVREKFHCNVTELLPLSKPYFALEVSHPDPKPLIWSMRKATNLDSDVMLCGLSTLDSKAELVRLNDTPHTLIAGITGAGKSILLQMMLLSLTNSTSPSELELVLIDLKNEDLVPFKDLPHVKIFAGNREDAVHAVNYVVAEKDRRIREGSTNSKRIVLAMDELAQFASNKAVRDAVGDLTSIGRAKRVNLIAATQNVTKEGGIGSMMKANFTCRLVGKVAPGLSAIATGLPNMYAHLLPGKGSFLRIEGSNNHRFQSYYIDHNDVALMTKYVSQQYKLHDMKSDTSLIYQPDMSDMNLIYTSKEETLDISYQPDMFPIKTLRDFTAKEIAEIKRLSLLEDYQYLGKPSIAKLTLKVFGSREPIRSEKVKKALEEV